MGEMRVANIINDPFRLFCEGRIVDVLDPLGSRFIFATDVEREAS